MNYVVTTADGDHSLPVPWPIALAIVQRGNTAPWARPEWLPYRLVQENLYTGSQW